jgi:hypothetical protein
MKNLNDDDDDDDACGRAAAEEGRAREQATPNAVHTLRQAACTRSVGAGGEERKASCPTNALSPLKFPPHV